MVFMGSFYRAGRGEVKPNPRTISLGYGANSSHSGHNGGIRKNILGSEQTALVHQSPDRSRSVVSTSGFSLVRRICVAKNCHHSCNPDSFFPSKFWPE